jgi:hypothetical protein
MQLPYEILIRAKEGVILGAHALDTATSPARPLTAGDLEVFGPSINIALLARIATLEAEAATLDAVRTERDTAKAALVEHQAISDRLVVAARSAIEANDQGAMQQILHAASLYGTDREAARLDEEATALEIKLVEIAAKKAALT